MTAQPAIAQPSTDSAPADFFNALWECFELARQTAGTLERFYQIGGYSIRLQFAGPSFVAGLTPALEHLSREPDPAPAFTICIWDSASTGVKPPRRPWTDADHLPRGEIRGYNDERFTTNYDIGSAALSILDSACNVGIYWRASAANLPYYETAQPFQQLLPAWLRRHQRYMVHAAAVGVETGGVLIAGKSGSGKSTTALACLESELRYLSDDGCLLTNDPSPYAYSLFSTGKLKPDSLARFPELAAHISNVDQLDREKATVFLNHYLPHKLILGFPVKALLLPRVTGQRPTSVQPASPMQGLRTLAPSTLFQTATETNSTFAYLARFVRSVPTYYLDLGTDLRGIPNAITNLLRQLGV